jgi:hypothetical protein
MRYMLLYCGDEQLLARIRPVELDRVITAHQTHADELRTAGKWVEGNRLQPSAGAARVVVRDGEPTVLDGPFAEAKEVVAGYDVVECQSIEEAIACARRRIQLEAEHLRDLPEVSPELRACAETYAIQVRPVFVW